MHLKTNNKSKSLILPIILIIALILIITVLFILFKNATVKTGGEPQSSSSQTSSVSSLTSSINSSEQSSSDISSEESSKEESSSKQASSTPSSKPKPAPSSKEQSSEPVPLGDGELPAGFLTDWNLILLNPEEGNEITKELQFDKTEFDYNQRVDSRTADAYKKMREDAKQAGITLFLRSGYRSMNTQRVNYNANVQRQMNLGYSKEEAIKLTNLYYTVPGHSEHHSGLAFDIITPEYHKNVYTLNEKFAQTKAYEWLKKNCVNYGFILRYPKEKQDITTINFEPWHYRYVGVEHAKYIAANGLCFEEYIDLLKEAGR